VTCHSDAAGRSLGLELGQLNGDYVYSATNRISNQLKTFEHIGLFEKPLGKPVDQLVAYPDPYGTTALEQRARAYIHANCSNCHRPKGPGGGNMDLRFGTAFVDTKTCNVTPQGGDIGVANAKLITPGMPETSLVSLRPHSATINRMPPLASTRVDEPGVKVLDDWIRAIAACP
jgi:mono/diheme cytochrome c family protein